MIINRDEKPKNTIYYIAACIYDVLINNQISETTKIFEYITNEMRLEVDYQMFLLSLNFLFLMDKIDIDEQGGINCI
ncbi:ABC-three component system middle component 6 [Ruoffia tabacinasalis]|uniref:ABC-three component system middle component 6 n=1 Tax=Ruoffia tabacinasalis TaxID=87458 RepID=UPI003F95095A